MSTPGPLRLTVRPEDLDALVRERYGDESLAKSCAVVKGAVEEGTADPERDLEQQPSSLLYGELSAEDFLGMLSHAQSNSLVPQHPDLVFADLGCGSGKLLLWAHELGFSSAIGVEYVKPLCEQARRALCPEVESSTIRVIHGSFLEQVGWAGADVVFVHALALPSAVRWSILEIGAAQSRSGTLLLSTAIFPLHSAWTEAATYNGALTALDAEFWDHEIVRLYVRR